MFQNSHLQKITPAKTRSEHRKEILFFIFCTVVSSMILGTTFTLFVMTVFMLSTKKKLNNIKKQYQQDITEIETELNQQKEENINLNKINKSDNEISKLFEKIKEQKKYILQNEEKSEKEIFELTQTIISLCRKIKQQQEITEQLNKEKKIMSSEEILQIYKTLKKHKNYKKISKTKGDVYEIIMKEQNVTNQTIEKKIDEYKSDINKLKKLT